MMADKKADEAALCRLLNIDGNEAKSLIRAGVLVKSKGSFNPSESVHAYIKHLQSQISTDAPWELPVKDCLHWADKSRNWFYGQGFNALRQRGRESLYDVRKVIAASFGCDSDEQGGYDVERTKLIVARRVAQELENEEAQGYLRPVAEVETAVIDALTPVVAALDSLPMAIKRACPELSQTAIEMVEREIATMRNTLADDGITGTRQISAGKDIAGSISADGG